MTRVLVVDDHSLFREGLKQIIAETPDLRVTGEAVGGHDALRAIEGHTYDVVVMDLSMPEGSGLEALMQLRSYAPDLPVLILSMHPEQQYGVRVLKAGACGYLSKDAAPDHLIEALRKVAAGGRYVTPTVAERLAEHLSADTTGPLHETLSEREFQVLRLLAQGLTVGEIADTLALSVKTVSTYRSRLLEKMNMQSNAEVTRYALEHKLVE